MVPFSILGLLRKMIRCAGVVLFKSAFVYIYDMQERFYYDCIDREKSRENFCSVMVIQLPWVHEALSHFRVSQSWISFSPQQEALERESLGKGRFSINETQMIATYKTWK